VDDKIRMDLEGSNKNIPAFRLKDSMSEYLDVETIEDEMPPRMPLLKRVYAASGLGWPIQCLCFEFVDNTRRGFCFSSDHQRLPLTDQNLLSFGGEWVDVPFYGDYITNISGYHQVQDNYSFMCQILQMTFKSGTTIKIESFPRLQRGTSFAIDLPEHNLLTEICFSNDATLSDLIVTSTSIHLPLSKSYRETHLQHLPNRCKDLLLFILLTMFRLGMINEVSWEILSYMHGYDLLELLQLQ